MKKVVREGIEKGKDRVRVREKEDKLVTRNCSIQSLFFICHNSSIYDTNNQPVIDKRETLFNLDPSNIFFYFNE